MKLYFTIFQLLVFICILYPHNYVCAAITTPKIFSDNMVLQREKPVPVWGWAGAGDKITVEFAGQRKETTAGADGRWEIRLDPMPACKEGGVLTITGNGKDVLKFSDVVVGEVWICSGQSNMAFGLGNAEGAQKDIEVADLPGLRLFQAFNITSSSPKNDLRGRAWTVCSSQTAGGWTAVGFYFGRRLVAELGVPVGLISAAWGGTRIEPWTPMEAFDTVPELSEYIGAFRKDVQAHRETLPEKINAIEQWLLSARKAVAANEALPLEPDWPVYPGRENFHPAAIYNAMLHPLVPYAIRGAIWYQGEANASDPGFLYYHKLRALIGGWRHNITF